MKSMKNQTKETILDALERIDTHIDEHREVVQRLIEHIQKERNEWMSRSISASGELAVYKQHILENAISCTTCARNECDGCTYYTEDADVLLWEPEVGQ